MLNNAKNIIYLRISHTESLNGTSLEVQEKRCLAYCQLHEIRVDKVYSEITSGATEFRKRPVFEKVLDELSSGSRLIVSRLDRLSRDIVNTLTLVKDFKEQREKMNEIIDEINKNLTLVEKIKKFYLINENFSIENGLLTPTMKVKRNKVVEKYKNILENLYKN